MRTAFSLLFVSFNSGLGAYDKAVVKDENGEIIGKSSEIILKQSKILHPFNRNGTVSEPFFPPVFSASRFMAYHTPLANSQEFTAALKKARELAHNITMSMRKIPGTSPDFEVFPYTYVLLFPKLHLIFPPLQIVAYKFYGDGH